MKNTNPQPILCGTDFSENAQQAANAAAALAKRLCAPLRLVHASVIHRAPLTEEHLRTEAQRLHDAGADLTAEVLEGDADQVLAQVAQQHAARLVIVSSLGRRAPARWLLGSVAERISESSPVPTLVVRDAAPFEAWARGERALKVSVGADFTASSDAALRWIAELRQLGPCEVVVGYVDWPPEEAARLGVSGAIGLIGNLPAIQRVLERDVREKVTRVLGEGNAQVRVVGNWGRTDAPLVAMAIEAQADLVVVGTHQRQGLDRLRRRSISLGGYYQDSPCNREHAQLVAESEAKLRALAPHEAEVRGIVTEVAVTESRETAEAICAAAERFGADVICVGSHTRPGFTAKVLGSVSLAVLQGSRRPVLVVWPPAE